MIYGRVPRGRSSRNNKAGLGPKAEPLYRFISAFSVPEPRELLPVIPSSRVALLGILKLVTFLLDATCEAKS
jgi:hypothetical protein